MISEKIRRLADAFLLDAAARNYRGSIQTRYDPKNGNIIVAITPACSIVAFEYRFPGWILNQIDADKIPGMVEAALDVADSNVGDN